MKLRAAVVGTNWGQVHISAIEEHPEAGLVAIAAREASDKNKALAERLGVPLYTSVERMMAEQAPGLVTIAAREEQHAGAAIAALRGGAHVYCEKVLADNVESARAMLDAARETGRQLMVGYSYRFSPSARHVRRLLEQGRIGTPLYGNVAAIGHCVHHATDLVCSMLGRPARVQAAVRSDALPGARLEEVRFPTFAYSALTCKAYTIAFENGALVQFISSDHTRYCYPGLRFVLGGTEGVVTQDDICGAVTLQRDSQMREVYEPSQILDVTALKDICRIAVRECCSALSRGAPVPVPGEDGLKMMLLEEAIARAANSGAWESVGG